jgi:siroheme synthase (precorrin-2 oxidase/ferrochelatase)
VTDLENRSCITDILMVGGGKAGLVKFNFAKGLAGQVNLLTCDVKSKEKISQDDMEGANFMVSFAKLTKQDGLDYETQMKWLEAEIRTSDEATRAAIVGVNEQKANTDATMLASFTVLISLQSKGYN